MSALRLRYGTDWIEAAAPRDVTWIAPPDAAAARPGTDALVLSESSLEALFEQPTTGPALASLCPNARRAVIVVPDRTRPAAVDRLLPAVVRALRARWSDVSIELAIGGGTHAPESPERTMTFLPPDLRPHVHAWSHDSRDPSMTARGVSHAGTAVMMNDKLYDHDLCIAIGGVGYHYFAGFSGGRKALFPGLGAYEAIRQNHRLILDPREGEGLHPSCRPGNLEGNPVHLDALDIATRLPVPVFALHVAVTPAGDAEDVLSGDLVVAHAEACRRFAARHRRQLPARARLVVADAGGHPRDIDLIQVHKALVHLSPAVVEGGAVVLAARCAEGIGSPTFERWFQHGTSIEMERALRADYTLNSHTALSFRRMTERFSLHLVSGLDEARVRAFGAFPHATLEEALSAARERLRSAGPISASFLPSPMSLLFEIGERSEPGRTPAA